MAFLQPILPPSPAVSVAKPCELAPWCANGAILNLYFFSANFGIRGNSEQKLSFASRGGTPAAVIVRQAPYALATFGQSKHMMEAAQSEAHSPERSPRLSRNLVFARVSKGSKRGLELARGIEPPTG